MSISKHYKEKLTDDFDSNLNNLGLGILLKSPKTWEGIFERFIELYSQELAQQCPNGDPTDKQCSIARRASGLLLESETDWTIHDNKARYTALLLKLLQFDSNH